MAAIDKRLFQQLKQKLGVSSTHVYRLIDKKARSSFLRRHLAAISLAAENGINIQKYATAEELAELRGHVRQDLPIINIPVDFERRTSPKAKRATKRKPAKRRGNSVFVVHGRNEELRKSLFSFLRAVGLNPIEWRKAIQLTGKPSPYVAEILDAAFREAVAVIVLLSPDDQAKLRRKFLKPNDPSFEKQLSGQARPNVLFEAGMAFGRNPDSTLLIQVGEVRPFSDIAGRHVMHLNDSPESRQEFLTKLANAGCNVDSSGSDYFREGTFSEDR